MIKKILSVTTGRGKALIMLASLAFTASGLLGAYLIYVVVNLINNITDYNDGASLGGVWLTLFIIVGLKAFIRVVADMAKHFAGFDVVYKVRESIIHKLKRFSLGFFSNERLGEISTIIHKDVDKLEGVVGHFISIMISDVLIALVLGVWLFSQSVPLGIAMVSLLPFAVIALMLGLKKNRKLQNETGNDLADMVSLFIEYTKGIPLMRAFPENSTFEKKLQKSIDEFGKSSRAKSKSVAIYVGRFRFFFELANAVMLIAGAVMLYNGTVDITVFLMFVIFSSEFYKPFSKMENYWRDYLDVKDSYQRVEWLLSAPVVPETKNPIRAKAFNITYENVGFSYESKDNALDTDEFSLQDVSFHVPQGSLVALVGPSGSGKTTITNLLLRFWDNQDGSIKVGGVDIRDMDYDDLLSNISIVMQNVVLFADSIYENIRIGNKNATKEQVIEAAQKAQIHDFIMTLPDGYDTQVGENGVGLSGGQKQRLSIARAFLKDAPIVILDEITSNVDPVNEARIQKAVSTLAQGRSVLVIAHHLKTIRGADQIVVFNKGEIIETGTHRALLDKNGLYAQLWQSQEEAKGWRIA